jgi:uncharacterized DUF497 family protein
MDIPKPIAFQWDEGNRDKNKYKHQVDIQECEEVFFHSPVFLEDEKHSLKEKRFLALGKTLGGRLLFVVFTIRDNFVRVISARDQNKKERSFYYSNKG